MVSRRTTAALVAQLFLARRRRAHLARRFVDRGRDPTRQGDGCDGGGFSPRFSRTTRLGPPTYFSSLRRPVLLPVARAPLARQRRSLRLAARRSARTRAADACAHPRAKTSRRSRSAGGARLCDRTVAQRSLVFALGALLSVARRFADGLPPAARLAAVDERQRLPAYFSAGSGSAAAAACHSRANPLSGGRNEIRRQRNRESQRRRGKSRTNRTRARQA